MVLEDTNPVPLHKGAEQIDSVSRVELLLNFDPDTWLIPPID
jgi:hypothetical protein